MVKAFEEVRIVLRVEKAFVTLALEIGLAETIAETLKDVERAIADLPDQPSALRRRRRLEDQRAALKSPTLRNVAALVVARCDRDPSLTPRIRRAFADLAEHHPELAWLHVQLPPPQPGELTGPDAEDEGRLRQRA